MRTLLVDIETAPNLAFVWGLFKENISPSQIENSGYVLCWSAKWADSGHIYFQSAWKKDAQKPMLEGIHQLLGEADVVVHYNGKNFDIPTLNKEFIVHNMKPPAPYRQVDLLKIVRAQFAFPSNKLAYVAEALGLGSKASHHGFRLWIGCMREDPEAWRIMERYNRQDVKLLDKLYNRLLPWIPAHPNHGAYDDNLACPNCGAESYQRRGTTITNSLRYQRYQCGKCGGWFRGNKTISVNKDRFVAIGR